MSTDTQKSTTDGTQLSDAIRWALAETQDSAMASADWLAADLDSSRPSAVALITGKDVTLQTLERAKRAYKTMRIVGETTADRRLAARLYAATIAAALVHHRTLISEQTDEALNRAFASLRDDVRMPGPLRELGRRAVGALKEWRSREP